MAKRLEILVNHVMKLLLRSPFHRSFSQANMLITVLGRKSGKKITTPVSYYRDGDVVWVTAFRRAQWWRNAQANPSVELFLQRKVFRGQAEIILDEKRLVPALASYLRHVPGNGGFFGVRMENGEPNMENLSAAVPSLVMLEIMVEG